VARPRALRACDLVKLRLDEIRSGFRLAGLPSFVHCTRRRPSDSVLTVVRLPWSHVIDGTQQASSVGRALQKVNGLQKALVVVR
jgi:hypothetical protein